MVDTVNLRTKQTWLY